MSILKNIANNFSDVGKGDNGTQFHTANSETVKSNQLENSIEQLMAGSFEYGITNQGHYYQKTGYNDDLSLVLKKMTKQSTTHAGIIQKKGKMVAGLKFKYDTRKVNGKRKATEVDVFIKNAAGAGKSLHSQFRHAAGQYMLNGGYAILIKYNKDFTGFISVRSLDAKEFRRATDIQGIPIMDKFVVRRQFGTRAESLLDNESRYVAAFNKFNKKDREQLLYVMNPDSGQPYYGIPNYVAAYNYIAADHEFGTTILNSSSNGFMPKVMATFFGRNMTDDQKAAQSRNFKSSFFGSKAEPLITAWVKREEEKPLIDILDVKNLDKTLDVMSRLNDQKILTAHNITSPTLFGVMVSGTLAGSGNEMLGAYEIFRATETLPDREMMLESFNMILESLQYNIELKVEDVKIDLGATNGAGSGKRTDLKDTTKKDEQK